MVVQAKSIKNNKTGICYGIKTLSYHGYSCFKHVSSINSSLLIFVTFISDKRVCFRVRKCYGLVFLG